MEKEAEPLELSTAAKEQVYAAVDQYFEFLKKNFASVPTGGPAVQEPARKGFGADYRTIDCRAKRENPF
jgi:hypothetical protein